MRLDVTGTTQQHQVLNERVGEREREMWETRINPETNGEGKELIENPVKGNTIITWMQRRNAFAIRVHLLRKSNSGKENDKKKWG